MVKFALQNERYMEFTKLTFHMKMIKVTGVGFDLHSWFFYLKQHYPEWLAG